MLAKIFALTLVVVVASAAPKKRQLPTCTNAFTLTVNPCTSGQGRTYYPVQGDPTKFVQCDILQGAYVVQCPQGLLYNQATNSCQQPQAAVATTPAPSNPCTVQNINSGSIFFAYAPDNTKFQQCTAVGQVSIVQCPKNLVWDQNRVSCVLQRTNTGVPAATQSPTTTLNNPCTPQQIAANNLYFAHPDPSKFIQCDLVGNAYEMLCPSGLIWNQYFEVCSANYQLVGK